MPASVLKSFFSFWLLYYPDAHHPISEQPGKRNMYLLENIIRSWWWVLL